MLLNVTHFSLQEALDDERIKSDYHESLMTNGIDGPRREEAMLAARAATKAADKARHIAAMERMERLGITVPTGGPSMTQKDWDAYSKFVESKRNRCPNCGKPE